MKGRGSEVKGNTEIDCTVGHGLREGFEAGTENIEAPAYPAVHPVLASPAVYVKAKASLVRLIRNIFCGVWAAAG